MTTLLDSFVGMFGQAEADRVFVAAREHAHGQRDALTSLLLATHGVQDTSTNEGSDPFGWAVMIALSYQCMEVERYREHHGFVMPWENLHAWCRDHAAELRSIDGDIDDLFIKSGDMDTVLG